MADAQPEPPKAGTAATWIAELDAAEKDQGRQSWLKRAEKIIRRYTEQKEAAATEDAGKRRFALLWSNVNTLAPAIYARTPQAVVTRRWKSADPVGLLASTVLERALNFAVDAYDFSAVMTGARDDLLLLARGQAWVRYVPHFETVEPKDGEGKTEPYEAVQWEEARADHIHWRDFGHNVARSWSEVWLVYKRAFMTRAELVKRFGEKVGAAVPLDWSPKGDGDCDEGLKKAAIYELWDSRSRKARWVSKLYPDLLEERDDPLKLPGFFPCPRPLFGTLGPDSLVPTPDYVYYQDQAEEVDDLTGRIDTLTDALKVRGFYAGQASDNLNQLFSAGNTTLIPVDSWAALKDQGGVKGLIEWFPVEQIITTLKACIELRKQLLDDVHQITGISDILRGDTDPNETLGAQQIKASWGSSRVRDRQKELARFARDILRLMGAVIASKFGQETLAEMTDVQLLTAQEREELQQQVQAYQQLAAQAQQAGQPPPPPPLNPQKVELLQKPTWDDVMALLRNPELRAFRIDIETDSTIEPNDQEEKQRRIEFAQALGKVMADSLPIVQTLPQMLPVVVEGIKFLVRGFRVGREMEDTIEKALDQLSEAAGQMQPQQQQGAPPADPQVEHAKAQAAATNAQASVMSAQARMADAQTNQFRAQSAHELGAAQIAAENARTQATLHQDAHQHMTEVVQRAEDRRLTHEINSQAPIAAPTR